MHYSVMMTKQIIGASLEAREKTHFILMTGRNGYSVGMIFMIAFEESVDHI